MMATSYRAGALTRSGRRLRAAGGVDPLLLREHADLGAQSLEHVDRGLADGRPLVVAEHLEEQLANGAVVIAHGAEQHPPALGRRCDPGAAAVGVALAAEHQLPRLHARDLVRDAALLPGQELGEFTGA